MSDRKRVIRDATQPVPGPTGRPRRDLLVERTPAATPLASDMAPILPASPPTASSRVGATGRVRRDPRAAAGGQRTPAARASVEQQEPNRLIIDEPACFILAVPDLDDGRLSGSDKDLLGVARTLADGLGGAVVVVAFGAEAGLDFGVQGVDRLVTLDGGMFAGYAPEARAAAVWTVIESLKPRHVLLVDTPFAGGDLGRRLAARSGEVPAFNVQRIEPAQVICRGNGGRSDYALPPPKLLLLGPDVGEPFLGPPHEARNLPTVQPPAVAKSSTVDKGLATLDSSAVSLAEADFIISAGNGVIDWDAFHRLAAALGAVEAGSRVVVDAGFLPRDRQVGATGTLVEPRCYLAFGIAGAPQHLQGIARCQRVIAVNTDLHADMVKRADLAIVADAQAVMPALERRMLRRRRTAAPETRDDGVPE